MSEIELKPCPLCGSKAAFETTRDGDGENKYYVYCTNEKCDINRFWSGTKDEAAALWNRRVCNDPQKITPLEFERLLNILEAEHYRLCGNGNMVDVLVPLIKALELVKNMAENVRYAKGLEDAKSDELAGIIANSTQHKIKLIGQIQTHERGKRGQ